MARIILSLALFISSIGFLHAQQSATKEELERQRLELKKELDQVQDLLDKNKKTTKENLTTLLNINKKLNLQENVVETINKEINLMDNDIYKSQREINKMRLLLDTLKDEYAKSMVYAYKNRSNSDFLNFIFSSSSFNDAIKRITYLKSYRNYREMQGENILRTQTLIKTRIEELSQTKQKKNTVLKVQSKEVNALQAQQEEKQQIVNKLKAQGKELNNQIAAKKQQMKKVNSAITAAINRAIKEAKAAEAAKVREEKKRRDAAAKESANTASATKPANSNPTKSSVTKPESKPATAAKSVLLPTEADVTLNTNFEKSKGNLPWPVGSGYLILHFGDNKLPNGVVINSQGISIGSNVGTPVKAIFSGEVVSVGNIDDLQMVVVKHGKYFTTYSNITGVNLSKGQSVQTGQVIGRVAENLDGVGAIDLWISNERSEMNPEAWLKRR